MEEMDAVSFMEWVAFDALEPLDPAGAILKGFAGGKDQVPAEPKPQNWEKAYAKMHKIATAKDRVIRVPKGQTPQQEWEKQGDEW